MEAVSLIGMLGICSWDDIKRRKIRLVMVLVFGILGLVLHLIHSKNEIWDILGGILVGMVLFGASVLSRESIGRGDALLIIVTGIYLGFWENLLLLLIASFFAGMTGLLYICTGNRKKEIPFAPYVLVAYVIMLVAGGNVLVS